jgi:hypothetical protein
MSFSINFQSTFRNRRPASPYIITVESLAIQKSTVVVISTFLDTVRQGWYLFFVSYPKQGQRRQQVADKLSLFQD